ncbi:MAG: sulfotransferase [Acetobacteraceae bacterium]|jgi:hypothetical protein
MSTFQRLHGLIGTLGATQMFFIGGSQKSGTTWLQLLLDAHPQVACKGEGHVTNHMAQLLLTSLDKHNQKIAHKNRIVFGETDGFPLYTADDLAYLIGATLLLAFTKLDAGKALRAVGEKTPDNVRCFEVLHAIFPAAKFLNVVRDGRDCAISGWFHNLRTNPDWIRAKFPSLSAYAAMFAREWATDIALADRFATAHPLACLTVRYEDLLAGTAPVLRDVLDFLGVPAGAEVVAQCRDAAAFERLSAGRARGEENRESFFRNGTQGNWREHLDDAASRAFADAAAPWLERLGYL